MRRTIDYRETLVAHEEENAGATGFWLERMQKPYLHSELEDTIYVGEAWDELCGTSFSPLYLPVSTFDGGIQILGAPDQGKTHRAFANLGAQMIQRPGVANVFVDLKPDLAYLHFISDMAALAGKPMYVFTNIPNQKTHVWPFRAQPWVKRLSSEALIELLVTAVGMVTFSSQEDIFYTYKAAQLARLFDAAHGDSFWHLQPFLTMKEREKVSEQIEALQRQAQLISPQGRQLAERDLETELLAFTEYELQTHQGTLVYLDYLSRDGRLSASPTVPGNLPPGTRGIDLERAFTHESVYYFALDPSASQIQVQTYLSLLIASLSALASRAVNKKVKRTYVWMDEAYKLPHELIALAVSQWRGKKISPILGWQSRSQFSPALSLLMEETLNCKIVLGANSVQARKYEVEASGTIRECKRSYSYRFDPELAERFPRSVRDPEMGDFYLASYTEDHVDVPRHDVNRAIDMTNRPGNAFLTVHKDADVEFNPTRGGGYQNEIHLPFPLTKERFEQNDSTPLSDLDLPGMVDIDHHWREMKRRPPKIVIPGTKQGLPKPEEPTPAVPNKDQNAPQTDFSPQIERLWDFLDRKGNSNK